jgi:hypothetical protein
MIWTGEGGEACLGAGQARPCSTHQTEIQHINIDIRVKTNVADPEPLVRGTDPDPPAIKQK